MKSPHTFYELSIPQSRVLTIAMLDSGGLSDLQLPQTIQDLEEI